jgi:hypothetical protein
MKLKITQEHINKAFAAPVCDSNSQTCVIAQALIDLGLEHVSVGPKAVKFTVENQLQVAAHAGQRVIWNFDYCRMARPTTIEVDLPTFAHPLAC